MKSRNGKKNTKQTQLCLFSTITILNTYVAEHVTIKEGSKTLCLYIVQLKALLY